MALSAQIFLFFALFLSFAPPCFSTTLLQRAAVEHFQNPGHHRLGIEVETVGVEVEAVLNLAKEKLGGEFTIETSSRGLMVGTLENSAVGKLIVKHETNQTGERLTPRKTWVVELVTEPLHYEEVVTFAEFVKALPSIGAKGTRDDNHYAVSTQVNFEIAPKGTDPEAQVAPVLGLLRFYLDPNNLRKIRQEQRIPQKRQRFLGPFSPGFMAKLQSPDYRPSSRELFDDFFYRQSAELLAKDDATRAYAWTAPLEKIQADIRSLHTPVLKHHPELAKVIKLQSIRVSSWLMLMHPDDWFSKMVESEEWAKENPILEFRDWNTNFDLMSVVNEVVGLYFKASAEAEAETAASVKAAGRATCAAVLSLPRAS